jgi:hypothetical protein
MLSNKTLYYLGAIGVVMVASYIGNKFRANFEEKNDEYEMIRKYLLNDSPLDGYTKNKPILWIHSKFEYNARVWASFGSRSSTDLNQPYIYGTIQSIIRHCGDHFQICLINDESFSKLLPSWDIELGHVADPMRDQYRAIGMCELLYFYGGLIVPNTFLCMGPLRPLYQEAVANDVPFVCEHLNRNVNLMKQGDQKKTFLPSTYFMGANKNNETVKELLKFMKTKFATPHFSAEKDFLGEVEYWCLEQIKDQRMTLVDGKKIGIKTTKGKPILIDDLMEEEYLELSKDCVGIYVPGDEVLKRTKYNWFAVMPIEQVLETRTILSKYMRAAIISGCKEHFPKEVRNVIGI